MTNSNKHLIFQFYHNVFLPSAQVLHILVNVNFESLNIDTCLCVRKGGEGRGKSPPPPTRNVREKKGEKEGEKGREKEKEEKYINEKKRKR